MVRMPAQPHGSPSRGRLQPVQLSGLAHEAGEPSRRFHRSWLPKRFQIEVRATALGFINQDSSREEIYADYRRQANQVTGENIALKNLPRD